MPPSGGLPRRAWKCPAGVEAVEEGGWGYCGQPPAACLAPGSHNQCSHRGIVSVYRGELEAMRLNLKAEVTGQQEVVVGVTEVCKDPAAVAAVDGATAEVGVAAGAGAAAGADAGTASAGAVGPAPLPPQPQSGPHAPAPHQAPCHCSLLLPRPLPASAAFSAAGTMSHM